MKKASFAKGHKLALNRYYSYNECVKIFITVNPRRIQKRFWKKQQFQFLLQIFFRTQCAELHFYQGQFRHSALCTLHSALKIPNEILRLRSRMTHWEFFIFYCAYAATVSIYSPICAPNSGAPSMMSLPFFVESSISSVERRMPNALSRVSKRIVKNGIALL